MLIHLIFALASLANIQGVDLFTSRPSAPANGKQGTVIVFLSSKCPCSSNHIGQLKILPGEFEEFQFVGIHSNQDESLDSARKYFRAAKLPFPILEDRQAALAKQFNAKQTPQALVLKGDEILFSGGVSSKENGRGIPQLKNALQQIMRDGQADPKTGVLVGCEIAYTKSTAEPKAKVTNKKKSKLTRQKTRRGH